MTSRDLAFILKDVLDEYKILSESPLNSIKWVRSKDEKIRLINPGIIVSLNTGEEFEINIVQIK